jgi:Fur family ferric uptake transcriptional regulator
MASSAYGNGIPVAPITRAVDAIVTQLRGRQKRLTTQRRNILTVVLDSSEHLDIEQIRRRASELGEPVSSATVYRTMRMLVDEGIIKERHFKEGVARYEYVEEGEHHDHLICTQCGRVTEFTNDTIEELQIVVADKYGYRMTGHKHEIYGLCHDCR